MRLGVRCGIWRSPLGDTWPHDASVEMDWWPQAVHLVSEPTGLVLCAAGAGGGSQQAMFRSHLEPLLTGAHERWRRGRTASSPSAVELERLFVAIQHELETNQEHPGADNFQASAVALLIGSQDCALANVGVDRAWLYRDGRLDRISQDYTLADMTGSRTLIATLRDSPGSYFGRFGGLAARWQIRSITPRRSDVFVLAAGFRNTGVSESQLEAAVRQFATEPPDDATTTPGPTWRTSDRTVRRLGERLAELAASLVDEDARRRARWCLHSRLALAVVWFDG